jgi:hypothetical protein
VVLFRLNTGLQLTGILRHGVSFGLTDMQYPFARYPTTWNIRRRGGQTRAFVARPYRTASPFLGKAISVFFCVSVHSHPRTNGFYCHPSALPAILVNDQARSVLLDIVQRTEINQNGYKVFAMMDTFFASYVERSAWLALRVRTGPAIFAAGRSTQIPPCDF